MDKLHAWKSHRTRELAEAEGLTYTDLARKLGQTPRSVYAWFAPTPVRKPGKSALILLAYILKTNVDYLTYKSDNPSRKRIA